MTCPTGRCESNHEKQVEGKSEGNVHVTILMRQAVPVTNSPQFWQHTTGFWNRGGFWKAVLVVGVYIARYTGSSLLIGVLFGGQLDPGGVFASGKNVVILLLLPIAIGAGLIIAFLAAIRWLGPILDRQPIGGRPWMWIAVAIIVYPIILRLIGIPYDIYRPEVVTLALLTGLVIGLAEELVTRGAAVTLLRKGGYSELSVAVLSSALFAAMHSVNAIGSGANLTILILLIYTFFFGIPVHRRNRHHLPGCDAQRVPLDRGTCQHARYCVRNRRALLHPREGCRTAGQLNRFRAARYANPITMTATPPASDCQGSVATNSTHPIAPTTWRMRG